MILWLKNTFQVHQISLTSASKIAVGCCSLGPVCRVGCSVSKLYRCLRAEEWWDVHVLGCELGVLKGIVLYQVWFILGVNVTYLVPSNVLFCLFFLPVFGFFISFILASLSSLSLLSLLILPSVSDASFIVNSSHLIQAVSTMKKGIISILTLGRKFLLNPRKTLILGCWWDK